MKCSTCQHELEEGANVFEVQEGIMGTRGFVPLDSAQLFCSVECLKDYFTAAKGYDRWKVKRRVP